MAIWVMVGSKVKIVKIYGTAENKPTKSTLWKFLIFVIQKYNASNDTQVHCHTED